MVQHLTHTTNSPYMKSMRFKQGVFIEGKVDGQNEGPPNIEQPSVVQKKRLKKISDYGIILPVRIASHMSGVLINQKHDNVFNEARTGVTFSVLKSNFRLYDKILVPDISLHNIPYVLAAGGSVIDVSVMKGPMRNHHLIHMSVGEETHETNLGNQDVDKDVLDFLSDMLIESKKA